MARILFDEESGRNDRLKTWLRNPWALWLALFLGDLGTCSSPKNSLPQYKGGPGFPRHPLI